VYKNPARLQRCRLVRRRESQSTNDELRLNDKTVNEFWEPYPNKVAKSKCEALWGRLKLDGDAEAIMAGLKRWQACEQWQNPRFIPHPSTFLNQERWKDMPPVSESKGGIKVRESSLEGEIRGCSSSKVL
jgi:hypothetical protein